MFVLTRMKDTVRIPPNLLHLDTTQAITEIINSKLANKVVHNVGLCIALWDIEKFEDTFIFPGDGGTHTTVHFRYVVFRPFIDEVLIGKVKRCSREGVYVSMGFFDDVFIPADALQHPSKFNEQEQLWAWEYDTGEGKHDLYMDIDEEIRFRVMEEKFVEVSPKKKKTKGEPKDVPQIDAEPRKPPYTITGTLAEPGLGLLSWWTSAG
ncbi:hypothetical protein C0Q70_00844 [Pomacea canaliculata]|uniref:DNA-directed RNA polymerase III subunit RPC8 n=1 Tax=Pomacea canaliculata TaxID=400727 RepID=A0A2T7PXT1_POMCA|nr:DNA-directed RNA polymerase III subunit RPC8-like [Pomacea canaliculata]PVD38233.1 hypothetical protein C0Q70_00844 [Pomacea canaliculata]